MGRERLTRRLFLQQGTLAGFYSSIALEARSASDAVGLNPARKRPFLLVTESELPALREKLARDPSKRIYENYTRRARSAGDGAVEPLILLSLMDGDRAVMQAAGKAIMQSLRGSKERGRIVLSGQPAPHQKPRPGATEGNIDFSNLRFMHRLMNQYDLIASFSVLSNEERKEFEDYAFWMVEEFMTPRIRAINARERSRRHNFHSDNITIIGTAALCFPDHPRAGDWLKYALTDLAWQMEHSVQDGAWWEVPRYHGAVLRSILPFICALKRQTRTDFFKNEGLRGLLDWLVRCQTPRDKVYGQWLLDGKATGSNGAETMAYPRAAVCESPAVGDAEWVNYWFATLAMAAPAYKESDPAFAGRLMWGWDRAGGPYAPESSLLMAPLVMIDPTIKPIPQKLGSEGMLEAGYAIMRSNYDQPHEKYLFFNCGPRRETSHKHRDQNSFSIFAEEVPLALDSSSGPYRTPVHELWHKATISHNTVIFGERDQDMEDGRILQFITKEGADYLVGDASRAARVPQFHRHILFVKPDYFVIWDFIRSYIPGEWLLHSPAQEIRRSEHALEFVTPWGVSLDAHFLLPKEPISVWEGEGRIGHWQNLNSRGVPPFSHQKYVKVKNEAGTDFLTILHPRKVSTSKLTVKLLGKEENVIEVGLGEKTDYIMLFPVEKDFSDEQREITMSGTIGVVRQAPQGNRLTLVSGKSLSYRGQSIRN